ncbi:MAG: dihydrofolate reductase family protein [Leptospiraceae bacterium]|nr:dihydrofolate reductase family protein [Leptospiraceae bacterium]
MKVTVFIAVSIDGFIATKNGDVDWLHNPIYGMGDEDFGYADYITFIDCVIMGRGTYDKISDFDEWPFPERRVIVMSSTLKNSDESSKVEIINSTPEELITKLKKENVRSIYLDGGKTIQSFLKANLIDEITITYIPILLGSGISLFDSIEKEIHLKLLKTKSWENGFVQSKYKVIELLKN